MIGSFKHVLESGNWADMEHMFVRTREGVVIPACLWLLLRMCICGHKEYSVFISHRLREGSHGCARYKAIVGHLQVTYIGHGLLFAEV